MVRSAAGAASPGSSARSCSTPSNTCTATVRRRPGRRTSMPSRTEEQIITARLLREWPLPDPQGSKDSRGTVLVAGGSRFNPGAVLLAGVAALRAGAGRLQLAVESSTAAALSVAVPEARVVDLPERHGDVPAALLDLASKADVIAIGPGLDDVDETAKLMRKVLDA